MPNLTDFSNKKYQILYYLSTREGTKTTFEDISTQTHVSRNYVTKIVNELALKGYIQKSYKSFYLVTPLGKQVIRTIESEL